MTIHSVYSSGLQIFLEQIIASSIVKSTIII